MLPRDHENKDQKVATGFESVVSWARLHSGLVGGEALTPLQLKSVKESLCEQEEDRARAGGAGRVRGGFSLYLILNLRRINADELD